MKYTLLILLFGCTKQQDFSYLNTDRRSCKTFQHVSTRYSWTWDSLTTIKYGREEHCDSNAMKIKSLYEIIKWDPAKCPPPDPTMPEFRIEVRTYEEIIKN